MTGFKWVGVLAAACLATACSDSNDDGGSCASFSACGGDVQGSWQLDSICAVGLVEQLNSQVAAQHPECDGTYKTASIDVEGTVAFDATTQTPNLVMTIDTRLTLTADCLSAQADRTVVLSDSICSLFAQGASSTDADKTATTQCTFTGGNCECDVHISSPTGTAEPYTISGTTIVSGSESPADYCVQGDTLTLHGENDAMTMTYSAHRL
jgi:hypothetical protein